MATVYKKKYPIPMPDGAEIITRRGKRLGRWQSGKGQVRTAEVLADGRVQFVSDCWYMRYRDSTGRMRRESTGCRDRQAAEKVLADKLTDVEKVKAGVMSHGEIAAAGQLDLPIAGTRRTTSPTWPPRRFGASACRLSTSGTSASTWPVSSASAACGPCATSPVT
jgi:hypothetical protein